MVDDFAYVLKCGSCGKEEFLGLPQALRRLQSLGMLKRETEPSAALVLELLESTLDRMACQSCEACALTLQEDTAWDDAPQHKCCEQCGNKIDPERLEVFPGTVLCVACQHGEEMGALSNSTEVDFCPKCGNVMEVKKRARGITRYELVCTRCGM